MSESEPWRTIKIVFSSIGIVTVLMTPIILGCRACDTPERRETRAQEYHKAYQEGLQQCRNFCVNQGAESFSWNGKYGTYGECMCGGSLP